MLEQVQQLHITHVVCGLGLKSLSSASSIVDALAANAGSSNGMYLASNTEDAVVATTRCMICYESQCPLTGQGLSLSRTCKCMLATIGVALYNRPIPTK